MYYNQSNKHPGYKVARVWPHKHISGSADVDALNPLLARGHMFAAHLFYDVCFHHIHVDIRSIRETQVHLDICNKYVDILKRRPNDRTATS